LKLNGTQQLLVYTGDVNILGGSVRTVKKYTEGLLFGSKKIGLEVNADKTKYMVIFRDQNAERYRRIMTDNISFEMVEEFEYFGNNLNK
jgi:hypothetical protein